MSFKRDKKLQPQIQTCFIYNSSHWVAFPSVTKMTAKYYDQPGDSMDLIPTLSYGLGVPCTVMATVIVERRGLRVGLLIGGFLTGVGKMLLVIHV